MRLYNTLTRRIEDFSPLSPPRVGVYTCGPTVYNYQHIGNFRTYLFEDFLVRVLRLEGFKVFRVMNITDVGHLTSDADEGEDKMEKAAIAQGKTAWDLAAFYIRAFWDDYDALGIMRPDVVCKATDHIPEQIELVRRLEAKGFTYRIEGDGVYFDTSKLPDYGKLDPTRLAGLKAGARVELAVGKRNQTDFAIWKFSPRDAKRQMEWESPWGVGFPGWHIECSAMAMKYLGDRFDIHCGGIDHVPIHHTNEIAQSESATGKPWGRFWMHGEFLVMGGGEGGGALGKGTLGKMSKSAGGFITLDTVVEKGFSPHDFRYLCLTAHYRKQLAFSWEALDGAKNALANLREKVRAFPAEGAGSLGSAARAHESAFRERVLDDLDMPGALAAVWNAVKDESVPASERRALLGTFDKVLGLDLADETKGTLDAEVEAKIRTREEARKRKDFAGADSIRKELLARGIELEDTPGGTVWKRK